MATVLFLLDLLGTFVFALSGATVAVRNRLDLFGVLVLSCAAAVSGGIVRDVLIGATPPAALVQPQYLLVACLAGVAGFYCHAAVERLRNPVQIFDAAGLALFAVYGTSKALDYHLTPLSATLLGGLSANAKLKSARSSPHAGTPAAHASARTTPADAAIRAARSAFRTTRR